MSHGQADSGTTDFPASYSVGLASSPVATQARNATGGTKPFKDNRS